MNARIARVAITSRPLVGSSRITLRGIVHERARDRGLDALALREAFGAPVGDVGHVERGDQRVGAARGRVAASRPCSRAK